MRISQPCFARKVSLTSWFFFIPRPPSRFGRHILSHAIVCLTSRMPFLSFLYKLLYQKKFLVYAINFIAYIYLGILNQLMDYWGTHVIFDLVRTVLPTFKRARSSQRANLRQFCLELLKINFTSSMFDIWTT